MLISFKDLSKRDVLKLWAEGSKTEGWPDEISSLASFEQHVFSSTSEAIIPSGFIKGIWNRDRLVGFTSLHEVESGIFKDDISVFEGGTYLLPDFRGLGLNENIKQYLVSTTFHTYHGMWCVFCIPIENRRAVLAIEKLSIPFERITMADTNHPLHRYLKWKSWKTGKSFLFYGAKRDSVQTQ